MAAYLIAEIDVRDAAGYEEYRRSVAPTLPPFGGRFLVRGGVVETLEGDWHPARLVVIEFPSAEDARAWWASPQYSIARAIRQRTAATHMIVADGVA
jgi:uncharacterized protein (DUF1330 family)